MHLLASGKLVGPERCSTAWKTGGRDWSLVPELRRRHPQLVKTTRTNGRRNGSRSPGYVRTVVLARAISRPLPPSPAQRRDGFLWMSWSWSSRCPTALGAGRSKAKKGKTSGSRIEQRPSTPRQREGSESQPGAQGQGQGQGQGPKQVRRDAVRTEEEEMNRTWRDAGLGDRRAGGKFRANKGDQAKNEATRVGGWGRDKSMQRVLTPEQQRAESIGGRGRQRKDRAGTSGSAPAVKKQGRKPYEGFDSSPRGQHPPEYYKYGPYGPFAWKGITVGKLVEGEMHTDNVVFFGLVENEAEHEDREKANVAVEYTQAVADFDEDVGIQYFYAFARPRVGPRGDPWQDWTLVAQVAVESGAVFDNQGKLFQEMGSRSQDMMTQCVAWARPDLAYVRRPKFQIRLEPQEQFLLETMKLVDSTGDSDDPASYYETLCRMVDVDLEASASSVRRGYEALDENGRMECLKHIFTKHPVKILASARYDRQLRIEQDGQTGGNGSASASVLENDDEEENIADEDEEVGSGSPGRNAGREFYNDRRQTSNLRGDYGESRDSRGSREISEQGERSDGSRSQNAGGKNGSDLMTQNVGSALPWSESRGLLHVFGPPRSVQPRRVVYTKRLFRSAVRPFLYANLVEEIAQIRDLTSEKETVVYTLAK